MGTGLAPSAVPTARPARGWAVPGTNREYTRWSPTAIAAVARSGACIAGGTACQSTSHAGCSPDGEK
jgi:hypothetical protein